MSKSNGVFLSFSFVLLLVSVFSQKSVAFGSPVSKQSSNRPDPLRHFRAYNGGYDIRNKHYWASAACTGVYGYAVGGAWMLLGLGFGSYLIFKYFNGNTSTLSDHPDSSYLIVFSLLLLFTSLAIISACFIIATNQISLHRTRKLQQTVLGSGSEARQTIEKVTFALGQIQTLLDPYDPKTCRLLNSTYHTLRRESRIIGHFVEKAKHSSDQTIETLYAANLVVAIINLVLVITALVLLFFPWQPGFIIIIFCCWILTTLDWVMTGFDFFFYTFVQDTCTAFTDFDQNPKNNSLRSIIPCANSSVSDIILVEIGYTVHQFITKLNSRITKLPEQDEELTGVREICDPFSGAPNYSYAPENCTEDTIPVGELANILSRFTCYEENSTRRRCQGDGRFLPEASYVMAWAYSRSIQDLIDIFPDMRSLTKCTFLNRTVYEVSGQCKPFRSAVRSLWSSMLSLSIFMVGLVILWVVKAYQDWGRRFPGCSIIPRPI